MGHSPPRAYLRLGIYWGVLFGLIGYSIYTARWILEYDGSGLINPGTTALGTHIPSLQVPIKAYLQFIAILAVCTISIGGLWEFLGLETVGDQIVELVNRTDTDS